MKILFANLPSKFNRFMADLKQGMEEYAEVVWDFEEFWKCENKYDIVHIHWPEYLSYEIQSYTLEKSPIPESLLKRTIECLEHWKRHSTIIYTRHVQYPHRRHDEEFLNFYRLVTSYCQTVIHFAHYSIQQFQEFYPEHTHIKHVVIPHHNYASLPNSSTEIEARKKLNIDPAHNVMLVFGDIKENEKELIDRAFGYVLGNNKVLLAPKWMVLRRKIAHIRIREWVWKFEQWLTKQNKQRRINLGFIAEEDAHLYLNAADFMLIPRTTELNSGNITLGCTFGLVVVGKDDADIGEILRETGNPTFGVGNDESLKTAVEKAYQLKANNHGEKNRKLAYEQWNVPQISKRYIEAMNEAINRNEAH